jgi:mannose-6-phosphate isomerase-like protein (cupin superfamily)
MARVQIWRSGAVTFCTEDPTGDGCAVRAISADDRGPQIPPLPNAGPLCSARRSRTEGRGGLASDRLQLWFNNTNTKWHDEGLHAHRESDEIFVVLEGNLVVDVDGDRVTIGPGEFCCFPQGLQHGVVETHPALRTLMFRAPSLDDKTSE